MNLAARCSLLMIDGGAFKLADYLVGCLLPIQFFP
nr:MAG TPA: hypothetical protein [Caudoviricetes sp.]